MIVSVVGSFARNELAMDEHGLYGCVSKGDVGMKRR